MYDSGTVFDLSILDITDDDIRARFLEVMQYSCVLEKNCCKNVAGMSGKCISLPEFSIEPVCLGSLLVIGSL